MASVFEAMRAGDAATILTTSILNHEAFSWLDLLAAHLDATKCMPRIGCTLRELLISEAPADSPPLESWPALDSYIEELCSFGVDRLTREPHDLNAASMPLKNDLEDVACSNYRALIESFECADAVREGVARVRTRLDALADTLPALAEATRQFSLAVVDKQAQRQARLKSLSHMPAIADILDMPKLMRTLVASELYDEALELRDHALKLAAMHPVADDEHLNGTVSKQSENETNSASTPSLIASICDEIHVLTQQMVLQLLVVLRHAVQLPTCLRVVGFLRRLRLFSELRLRMLFLHCRGEWMRAGVEAAPTSTTQARLVHLSDSTRSMVFEIVTQYRAVFSDDDEIDADDDEHDTERTSNALGSFAAVNSSTYTIHSSAILFDWTAGCVADYLARLRAGVDDLSDAAALNTVLQQAMFCGQSLGRVGADFRAALPPMFERAVMRILHGHLHAALRHFEMMVDDNRWAPEGSSALRKDHASSNAKSPTADGEETDEQAQEENGDTEKDRAQEESFEPPQGVLDSPPLAVFLNGLLVALNDLRLCAPVALARRAAAAIHSTLVAAGEYMSAIGGPGGAFLRRADRSHFVAMSVSLRHLCVRHAARCLDHCMGTHGLIDVAAVDTALAAVFGDQLHHSTDANDSTLHLDDAGYDEYTVDSKGDKNIIL